MLWTAVLLVVKCDIHGLVLLRLPTAGQIAGKDVVLCCCCCCRLCCLQLLEQYLHTSVCLVLAAAVVASGRLPAKLNSVIQNLMAGLRKEPCR